MGRSRLVKLLGGVLVAALLAPSAVFAAGATAAPAAAAPTIKLGCSAVIPLMRTAHREIVCHWTAPQGTTVSSFRLWRWVDGKPRTVIATVTPDQPLRHADPNVSANHRYGYRVAAIGPNGSRVALSNLVVIRLGAAARRLALKCVFVVDGQLQEVWCNWSRSTRPAAIRYVLYRSVNGGAREAIYRTGLNGRRSFFDPKIAAGQTIRYAVVALAPGGRIVGVGGPVSITIPVVTAPAAAK